MDDRVGRLIAAWISIEFVNYILASSATKKAAVILVRFHDATQSASLG
jgi:hypothetical protein